MRSQFARARGAGRSQLAGPLHRDVDGRVEVLRGAEQRIRPLVGRHAQKVIDVMMLNEEFFVAGVLVAPGGLVALHFRQRLPVHHRHPHILKLPIAGGHTGHNVRDDHALAVVGTLQHALHGQDAAPGTPVEVEVVGPKTQSLANLFHPCAADTVSERSFGPGLRRCAASGVRSGASRWLLEARKARLSIAR